MGIVGDFFKARIGYELAGGVMDSISNALEKNAAESAAREKAAKEASDRNDMLRTLVFMLGNNIALDRSGKKTIVAVLSNIYDENISLFSIEDKIDAAYSEIKSVSPKNFFSSIAAINSDRGQTCLMYTVMMFLYTQLSDEGMALPVHAYNLALIKKFFAISRNELAQCYEGLGNKLEKDIDDIADIFEELTSEETIKAIEAENPTLVYEEPAQELPAPAVALENPKEAIEKLYYVSIQKANNDEFAQRFILADSNPQKIITAVKTFAKNCAGENALLMYDDSAFGNGKVGMLLTNKKLYVCNSFEKPVEIDLSAVSAISASAKTITVNNVKIDSGMINKESTVLLADFLQKAIPLAMKVE